VKGNVDLHDSLHSCRIAGRLHWNGLNEVLRRRGGGVSARVIHETWTRSDALLVADGRVPSALSQRDLPLGSYSAASQFSTAIFETSADAILLSIQPDIATSLLRHRDDGYLFYPNNMGLWAEPDRLWAREAFHSTGFLPPSLAMANLSATILRIRETSDAPILVYNVSAAIPGEAVHCHQGIGETLSTRIRRFNLELVALSEELGISVVDVDGLIARGGADRLKLDWIHLTPEGYALIAEEVGRILDDYGLLDAVSLADAR
jgi:hypothetical protein